MSPRQPARKPSKADDILGTEDASLLDVVDNLLNKGVVLTGDLTLGLAHVDLVYARLSLLLSAADRVLPGEQGDFLDRHEARNRARKNKRAAATPRRADARRSRA